MNEDKMSKIFKSVLQEAENYEKARRMLFISLGNGCDEPQDMLIYRTIGDVRQKICFFIERGRECYILTVPKLFLDRWDIAEDQLFIDAYINSFTLAQPRLFPCGENIKKSIGIPFMAINFNKKLKCEFACVTSTIYAEGASVLFYPGVAEKLAAIFNDDYYVAIIDTDKVFVHPVKSTDAEFLAFCLQKTNRERPNGKITDHIYLYSTETCSFSKVG